MQIIISHNNKNLQWPRHPGSRFLLRSLGLHHVGPITLIISLVREHTPPTGIAGQPIMGGHPLRLERPQKRLFLFYFFLGPQSYPILLFCLNNRQPARRWLTASYHHLISHIQRRRGNRYQSSFFTASRPVGVDLLYKGGKEGRSPFRGWVSSLLPHFFSFLFWIMTNHPRRGGFLYI